MKKLKLLEEKATLQKENATLQEQNMKIQDDKIKNQEEKLKNQEEKIKSQEEELKQLKVGSMTFQKSIQQINSQVSNNLSKIFTDKYTWRVNQFHRKLNKVNDNWGDETPLSRTFYTSLGHRLEVELYLNGVDDAIGKYVSIFFVTTEGVFDDVVSWPMKANIKYCVLCEGLEHYTDYLDTTVRVDACSFQKPDNNSGGGIGNFEFISNCDIFNVLDNNSLVINISVDYL